MLTEHPFTSLPAKGKASVPSRSLAFDFTQIRQKLRDIRQRRVPHDVWTYARIIVNDKIAHRNRLTPRDERMQRPELFRNFCGSLADNLEQSFLCDASRSARDTEIRPLFSGSLNHVFDTALIPIIAHTGTSSFLTRRPKESSLSA